MIRRTSPDTAAVEEFLRRDAQRTHTTGDFAREEVGLANRNSGLPLEALRHDVTPAGLHFQLIHFDVPFVVSAEDWRLEIGGHVRTPLRLSCAELMQSPEQKTLHVTLECAGNGRANVVPRWPTQPWEYGAVGSAEWTGTPLRHLLERAGLEAGAVDVAFFGADRGFDRVEHAFGRSLTPDQAMHEDVLIVWAMNGAPLPHPHGFPLRLIVPGWYGMASVKWLQRIEVLPHSFEGYQQHNYRYKQVPGGPGVPVTTLRVKSLMAPPGIPDWYTRRRVVEAGPVELIGRAWSGDGVVVTKVEVGVDRVWNEAALDAPTGRYAWCGWRYLWDALPGEYVLECRATDGNGATQPLEPPWDSSGFGNNAVHSLRVMVR